MTDLEPIARALAETLASKYGDGRPSDEKWQEVKLDANYPDLEDIARAVYLATLKAIRVPSDEALEAVGAMDNHEGYETADEDHRDWFAAMIDQLVQEAGDG